MALIADILLMAGALGAGFYCFVLASRLKRFTDLETGVGGAVAVLSAQVDDLGRALAKAQGSAGGSVARLGEATERAEAAAKQLELLVASLHDLPESQEEEPAAPPVNPFFQRRKEGADV
ncbi:hypothetical protein [Pseudoroseicyclus tamaricis]|uniref:Uncharacterized protein n=1 Tax=Pseudoroseicyclus tamaricis TaxID=2705421 RepID=A0A6B2JWM5_9RHOB|nr:hypothetical protein [Pseudoroseicyclus tamaricis]NDV02530.1 hypothetical protein [Pseudoroseicyclus tamaricis]